MMTEKPNAAGCVFAILMLLAGVGQAETESPRSTTQPARDMPQPAQDLQQPVRNMPQPVRSMPQPVRSIPQPVRSMPQPEPPTSSPNGASPTPPRLSALPVCALAPDNPNRLAVEPCRPATPTQARRAVRQVISRMPAQGPVLANPSRPAAGAPAGAMPAPQAQPLAGPPAPRPATGPVPLYGCATGVCRDATGAPHMTGAGNATIEAQGKLCTRNGVWLQCF